MEEVVAIPGGEFVGLVEHSFDSLRNPGEA
jgi:hypothetical protein